MKKNYYPNIFHESDLFPVFSDLLFSTQVVEYYEQCLRDMEYRDCENTLGSYIYKHWKKVITFKISYYSAITKVCISMGITFLNTQIKKLKKKIYC